MKKTLSVLALLATIGATGCSCSKTGEYKFDSIVMNVGDEEKTFSCSTEDKKDNPLLTSPCGMYEKTILELTKDGKLVSKAEDKKVGEAWYKIEDGTFKTSDKEDGTYVEVGKYEKGTLTMGVEIFGSSFKVVYKK